MKVKNNLRRGLLLVFMLQMIVGIMPAYAVDDVNPNVHVDLTAGIQEIYAGQDARISIPLVTDDKTAINVTVAIASDLESLPFIFDDSRPWLEVDKITDSGANPYFKPRISPTAKEKVYEIQLDIEYERLSKDLYRTTDSIYIRIINDQVEPLLGVVDYKMTQDPLTYDGANQAVVLTLGNSGTSDAHNIRASLSGFSSEGLHIYKGMDIQAIEEIKAKHEKIAYFYLRPSEDAKTDEYEIEVTLQYDDDVGAEYTRKSYIYIPVQGTDTKAIELNVNNLVAPDKVSAGDTFKISGVLENASSVEAEFVEVSLEYPEGFIPESKPKKIIRDMGPGQTEEVLFELSATEDLKTDHYPINLVMTYNAAGDDTEESFKEYVGVSVNGTSGLGRPKILIEDYAFEGEAVMAGEVFDLHLKFFNTSSDEIVKNIKVSVSSEEGVFSPADSSSSFFIERIERQGYYDYVLPIETKRDAPVKTHNLKLVMEYEDGEGNAYDSQEQPFKEEENLGISVSQPVRLETGDIITPFEAYAGSPSDIELEFYNMGRSDMFNMFVKLEGEFTSQDGTYFVGNFESGNSDYFMASITPDMEGEVSGNIVFTFEDALGNPSRVEKPFSYFASAMPDFDTSFEGEGKFEDGFDEDMMNPDEEKGYKNWLYAGILLVLVGSGIWYVRRKKKQKADLLRAMEEEDE
jgi:hypothetical protein